MSWIEVHQGLREHRKTYACAEMLKINRVVMVGTLVSLWLWALDNAQDGSLGGISDRTIARVCDWPEKKANDLISALVECGWLDKDGDILRIHDWTDYAGRLMERREKDKVRKKKLREKQWKSDGSPQEVHGKSSATVPIPYHTVPNHIINGNNTDGIGAPVAEQSPSPNDGTFFTVFWNSYPENARRRREAAWNAWKKLNPDREAADRIMECLEAWKRSKRWLDDNGEFIPNAENFLTPGNGYLEIKPAPGKQPVPYGSSGGIGEAEMEAIRRVMAHEQDGEKSE